VLRANEAEFEIEVGPHAPGDFAVLGFEADERLSATFELTATLAPLPGLEVDAAALLGEQACLVIHLGGGEDRFFHGIVSRVRAWEEGAGEARRRLRVTIVPRLWRLGKVVGSRIFQDLSVPEIVKQVLGQGEIQHRLALSCRYAPRGYCVQYNEPDLAFVSRLLEDEGILWFFEHEQGAHTMVLADAPRAHAPIPGERRLPFREASGMAPEADHVDGFSFVRELRPGKITLRDFDHRSPALDLTSSAAGDTFEAELEVYEYPGGFQDPREGTSRSARRLEAERAHAALHAGTSTSRRLTPGYWFALEDHPIAELDAEYVVVSVHHRGNQAEALGGIATGSAPPREPYRNDFTCIRRSVPWRPLRRTPRPVIHGAQTALVVGPSGEEIFTDEQGRIKVQFHWDREGKRDERASCWVRVAQAWAGPGWGALYLPRIGHEVVLEFLEGDPDRPIVAGSVYNGANPPPVSLPVNKTRSTLRSASSPGGDGSNELRFEDAAGSEEIFLHAQRDLSVEVRNDKTQRVGGNESLTVEKDRSRTVVGNQSLRVEKDDTSTVFQDQLLTVARDRTTEVGGSHTEHVARDQSVTVGGSSSFTVGLAASETVALAKALSVGGAYAVTVGAAMNELVGGLKAEEIGGAKVEVVGASRTERVEGSRSLRVGGDFTENVGKSRTVKIGENLVLNVTGSVQQVAGRTFRVKAKELTLSAEDQLTLRVGGRRSR
jgi:type VI secretion system secreted protein VgrG